METAAGDWQQEVPRSFPIVFLGWNQQCLGVLRNEVSFRVKYAHGLSSLNCEMKEGFKSPQTSKGKGED